MTDDLDPLLLRPEKAAELLSVGRTTVYALMRSGALRSVRVGTLRRIPRPRSPSTSHTWKRSKQHEHEEAWPQRGLDLQGR